MLDRSNLSRLLTTTRKLARFCQLGRVSILTKLRLWFLLPSESASGGYGSFSKIGFKFLVIHSGNFWRSWGFVLYNELKSSSRFWSAKLFSLLERPTHSVSVNRSMHTSDRARCQCDTVVNDANDVLFVVFNNRNSSTRFISLPILRHSKCAGRWISIDSTPLQSFSSAPYPSWTLLSSLL